MFRTKVYGNNPTHQVVLGFDDTLHSFFATVVDLDTHITLFDVGSQSAPLQNLVDFQAAIAPYLTLSQDIYRQLSIAASHVLPKLNRFPTKFSP
jgi:hypothetical protein